MTPTIVVPIKSHSRRLKDKNFVHLGGTPLYRWTLDSLTDTDAPIIVACNNPEIREEAEGYGYTAIDRPREWDHGTAWNVALHATDADLIGLCLVTCPFRRQTDVNEAVALFEGYDRKPVLSAVRVNHRSILNRHDTGWTRGVRDEVAVTYLTTGVVQLAKREDVQSGYVRRENAIPYEVPHIVGLDIDTPLDWCAAFGVVEHKRREKLMEGAA